MYVCIYGVFKFMYDMRRCTNMHIQHNLNKEQLMVDVPSRVPTLTWTSGGKAFLAKDGNTPIVFWWGKKIFPVDYGSKSSCQIVIHKHVCVCSVKISSSRIGRFIFVGSIFD